MDRAISTAAHHFARLRAILLAAGLTDELKWLKPCCTHTGRSIALIQRMKADCRLMFFKGALLDDPEGTLSDRGENTRGARIARFTDFAGIDRPA